MTWERLDKALLIILGLTLWAMVWTVVLAVAWYAIPPWFNAAMRDTGRLLGVQP